MRVRGNVVKRLRKGGQGYSSGPPRKWSCYPHCGAVTHEWGGVGGQHNSLVPFVEPAWVVSDRKATRLILTACRGATWELESPDRHILALGVRGDEESNDAFLSGRKTELRIKVHSRIKREAPGAVRIGMAPGVRWAEPESGPSSHECVNTGQHPDLVSVSLASRL